MGGPFDGFHCWIATDSKETWLDFLVVDALMKSDHFIHVHMTYHEINIAIFFVNNIVRFHGAPKKIISNQGSMFPGWFWTSFQEALGTQLNFSIAYHPETDEQKEITNKILEEMLLMYMMDQQKR